MAAYKKLICKRISNQTQKGFKMKKIGSVPCELVDQTTTKPPIFGKRTNRLSACFLGTLNIPRGKVGHSFWPEGNNIRGEATWCISEMSKDILNVSCVKKRENKNAVTDPG